MQCKYNLRLTVGLWVRNVFDNGILLTAEKQFPPCPVQAGRWVAYNVPCEHREGGKGGGSGRMKNLM